MGDTKPSSCLGVCVGLYRSFTFVLLSSCQKLRPGVCDYGFVPARSALYWRTPKPELSWCIYCALLSATSLFMLIESALLVHYSGPVQGMDGLSTATSAVKSPAFCWLLQSVRHPSSGVSCTFSIMWAFRMIQKLNGTPRSRIYSEWKPWARFDQPLLLSLSGSLVRSP